MGSVGRFWWSCLRTLDIPHSHSRMLGGIATILATAPEVATACCHWHSKLLSGSCPIFLYLKTTLSPCLSRTFRGLSRPKENPQKLHLTTIIAPMLTHIILPFRRPFRRAFADLSRPQKSIDFASHVPALYRM